MRRISFIWLSPTITWIGRKMGIDAHYFAKNSFYVLLGHGVAILRGLVTGYLVARFFAKDVYGQYQFILSVMGMLGLFGLPGFATSVSRAWSRGDAFSLRVVTRHQLAVCLIASAILLGCIPFLGHYGRENLWPLFLAAAVLFPLPPIAMVRFGGYTVGKARFDVSLRASIIWSVLLIVATTAIILFHQSALLMLLVSTSIPPLVYLWFSRSLHPPEEEQGGKNTRSIIKYGWQMTFSTLPVDLVWYLDKLLISHFLGLAQLATFSIALFVPEHVKVLLKQFIPVTFAKQASVKDSKESRRKLTQAVMAGLGIFGFGIAAYVLITPWLIPLLFPNYDAATVIPLTIAAAVTLIVMPVSLLSQYLEAQRMIREIWISNLLAAGSFAVAMILLIPGYGLMGAVLARGVFRFVQAGACWWFVWRAPLQTK